MKYGRNLLCVFLTALFCLGEANVQAQSYKHYITAITSGNWNSQGIRDNTTDGDPTDYQIGYSMQLPNEQIAYFEFDLTPIQGQTVTGCGIFIPGSTDYNITDYWSNVGANNRFLHQQFKVGIRPQGSPTLSQILTGNNNPGLFTNVDDAGRNQDLGYGWVPEGLHQNFEFDAFTYNTARLQTEVNTGGMWVFWGADAYDSGAGVENYIWGSTDYNTGIVLVVTTTTGPATGTPPPPATGGMVNGTYAIINESTGLALDVSGSGTADGTIVDSLPYNSQPNDQWTVASIGNDSFQVLGVQSGKALEVQGNSQAAGAPADIATYAAQGNQEWEIIPGMDPGTFTIEATGNGEFLTASPQGTAATLNPNDGSTDQEWQFQPPNYVPPNPGAPATLTATPGNMQVQLGWSAVAGVTGYAVQRSTVTGGPYTTIGTPAGLSYTDTALTNGTTYYYVVAAVGATGTSGNSPEANATPTGLLPVAPVGLTATGTTEAIILNWTASPGATGYTVYGAGVSGGPYTAIASGINSTSYTNTGLPPLTTNYYVVTATNATGASAYSDEASATTAAFSVPVLTWDATGMNGADPADGSGNWDTVTALWSNGATDAVWVNGASTGAVFGNGNGAAGTVTVGNITAASLFFNPAGSGSYTLSGGTLTLSGLSPAITANANATIGSVVSGTGGVMLGGTGTLTLTGVNTYTGVTSIAPGATLAVGNANALQSATLDFSSGSLSFLNGINAVTLGGLQGTFTGQSLVLANSGGPVALTVGGNSSTTVYANSLSGAGSVTKAGTGTLTLADANYTGATTVNDGGTLIISGGSVGSPVSPISVGPTSEPTSNNVPILEITGGTVTGASLNVGTVGNETGAKASITGNASASFGSVQIGSNTNTGGNLTIDTMGSVNLGAYQMGRDGGSGGGSNTGGGLIIMSGSVTAASVLSSSGVSGRTSDINISGGSLAIGSTNSTGAFELTSNVGAGIGAGNGYITQTGGSLTYLGTDGLLCDTQNDNADTDVSTVSISGAGTIDTLTGITLNAVNASPATAILTLNNGATLYLGSVGLVENQPAGSSVSATFGTATVGAAAAWSSTGPIILTGNTTFQTADSFFIAHNITLGGGLSGGGGLTVTGGGTLILSGNSTYTGATNVLSGVLEITGTLASTSSLSIASGATFYLAGGSASVSGAIINNGIVKMSGTPALTQGNSFTNNGVLDLINGPQTLPAGFANNGAVLYANAVQVEHVAMSGSAFGLTIMGYPEHSYQLQRAASLAAPVSWANVGPALTGTGAMLIFTDSSATGRQGFYKVQVSP